MKDPGILFSNIPGSGFDFNPGFPGYTGIPLGPDQHSGNEKSSIYDGGREELFEEE